MPNRVCRFSLVLLAGCSAAVGQRLVQELLRSEVVYPQEKEELQVSFAATWEPRKSVLRTPLSVEYGLTTAWQLGMRVDGVRGKSRIMAESAGFGIRRSFMDLRGSGFHMAVGLEVEIDGSDKSYEKDETERTEAERHPCLQYGPSIVMAKDLLRGRGQVFWQFDVGLTTSGSPVEYRHGAGGLFRTGPVVLTHEFTWSPASGPGRELYWIPGVVWRLPGERTWELAGGVPFGFARRTEPFCVTVKLTHEFESIRDVFRR